MPAVPTVEDLDDGVLTASEINATLVALCEFLAAVPMAQLRQTGAQSIPNAVFTAISFDTADEDTDVDNVGGHNPGANPSRYTARYAGWYAVSGGVGFATGATGVRATQWLVNGVVVNASEAYTPAIAGGITSEHAARSTQVRLQEFDYVELYAFQSNGGALNTAITTSQQPGMSVRWVRR